MLALKILFILCGIMYIISVILHKKYFSKLKDNSKISDYVALIALFLVFYILFGLLIFIFEKSILYKTIMLIFSSSPFILGKIATYEKEKLFTLIQFIAIILSVIFVLSYLLR